MRRIRISTTLALACWIAPNASASLFGAEGIPTTLASAASTKATFGSQAGSIVCENATYSGTLSEVSETARLAPSYSSCKAFGLSATVTTNGCEYAIHAGSEVGEETFGGTMDVSCGSEKAIVIVAGNCEVQIKGQSGLSGLKIVNHPASSPENASINFEISELAYTVAKDGAFCPFEGTGAKTDGTYTGEPTISGTSEATPVGFFALAGPATVPCEGEPEECEQQKAPEIALPAKIQAAATNPKIVVGTNTVTCDSSSMELTAVGIMGNSDLLAYGQELKFKNCKTANVPACKTVQSLTPFLSAFAADGKGNGAWEGIKLFLDVNCEPDFICRYSQTKTPHLAFTGGKGATIVANGTNIVKETITGEKNCAADAQLTATYTVSTPAELSLGMRKK